MPPPIAAAVPTALAEHLADERLASGAGALSPARLYTARALVRRGRERTVDRFATSVDALDTLLEGGLRRGSTVELIGRLSSGRFSLVLAVLAAATRIGEAAALVDLGDSLDPQTAAAAGVDLDRVLWARPRRVRDALAAAEAILGCGMPMLIVDLGLPPLVGGRGAEAGWLRLARGARAQNAALLIASPYRATGTAADVVLYAQGRRAIWTPRTGGPGGPTLLRGLDARLDLHKRRGGRPGAHGRYALTAADTVLEPGLDAARDTAGESAERSSPRTWRASAARGSAVPPAGAPSIAPVVTLRRRTARG